MSDIYESLQPTSVASVEPYSVTMSRDALTEMQSAPVVEGSDALITNVMASQAASLVIVLAEAGSARVIDGFLSPLGLILQSRAESSKLPVKTGIFPTGSVASGIASLLRLDDAVSTAGEVVADPLGDATGDADHLVRGMMEGRVPGVDKAVVVYRKEGENRLTLVQARGGSQSWWSFEDGSQVRLRSEPLMGFACGFAEIIAVDRS